MADVAEKTYKASVPDVFSGDDLVLMVDLGVENLHLRQRVRLFGVDTPNAIGEGADTEAGRVRKFVRNLTRDKTVTLQVRSKVGTSWVGVVTIHTREGDVNLNEELIKQGYAFNREKA